MATGQAVVAIQFARQCDPVRRATETRDKLISMLAEKADYPVVRGRIAPNLLFFTLTPEGQQEQWRGALNDFELKCAQAELVP